MNKKVYHGTTKEFDIPRIEPNEKPMFSGMGETSIGAFFSEDKDTAASFPLSMREGELRILKCYIIEIENPRKYSSLLSLRKDLMRFIEDNDLSFFPNERMNNAQLFKEHLENQGYDGLTFKEGKSFNIKKNKQRVWSVFNRSQILKGKL